MPVRKEMALLAGRQPWKIVLKGGDILAKLRIDTLYDISCDGCGVHRSTDCSGGLGMETSKGRLQKLAYKEGWIARNGKNLCPACAKAYLQIATRKTGSPRSHMLYPCMLPDPRLRKNARKTRETMPDGTTRLYCNGYKDPNLDGDVLLVVCRSCPNNVIRAQEDMDRLSRQMTCGE